MHRRSKIHIAVACVAALFCCAPALSQQSSTDPAKVRPKPQKATTATTPGSKPARDAAAASSANASTGSSDGKRVSVPWNKLATDCSFLRDRARPARIRLAVVNTAQEGNKLGVSVGVRAVDVGEPFPLATSRERGMPWDIMGVGTYFIPEASTPLFICGITVRNVAITITASGFDIEPQDEAAGTPSIRYEMEAGATILPVPKI